LKLLRAIGVLGITLAQGLIVLLNFNRWKPLDDFRKIEFYCLNKEPVEILPSEEPDEDWEYGWW